MPAIHLVERLENVHCVDKDKAEWESGYWVVSEETAQRLVGGYIYLHRGQDEPSHFGGEIISFHVHPSGPEAGRIVFRLHAAIEFKGIKAGRDGWGNEKKSSGNRTLGSNISSIPTRARRSTQRRIAFQKLHGKAQTGSIPRCPYKDTLAILVTRNNG